MCPLCDYNNNEAYAQGKILFHKGKHDEALETLKTCVPSGILTLEEVTEHFKWHVFPSASFPIDNNVIFPEYIAILPLPWDFDARDDLLAWRVSQK